MVKFGDDAWTRFLTVGHGVDDRDAAEVAKTLSDPLRLAYPGALRELGPDGTLSPSEFARESGEPPANVSCHVEALRDAGVIELGEKVARRGAREHRLFAQRSPRAVGSNGIAN